MAITDYIKRFFSPSSGFSVYSSCNAPSRTEYIDNIYNSSSFMIPLTKKVDAMKAIEWNVYKDVDDNKDKVKNHVLSDVFNMPNNLSTWGEFIEYLMVWFEAKDNGVLIEKISNGRSFKPSLKLHNPDNFTIYVRSGSIEKITITNPSRTILKQELENFLWIKQPNFNNMGDNRNWNESVTGRTRQWFMGLLGLFTDKSWSWNNSVVDNSNSRPGLYTSEKPLSPTDQEEFKQRVESKNSYSNKGKDLILTGNVKYTPLDHLPKDVDWSTGDETSHKRIAISVGVPAELVGSGESTYNNRREARKELYEETIIPFCRDLKRRLNFFLKEFLKNGEYIDFDTSSIPALQKDLGEAIDKLNGVKDRVSVNEYRMLLSKMTDFSLESIKESTADEILVPSSVVPLKELETENVPKEDEE